MIIINKTCNNSKVCIAELLALYPSLQSVNHFSNEHIIYFVSDYDIQGSPKKSEFDKVIFNKSEKIKNISEKEFSKVI